MPPEVVAPVAEAPTVRESLEATIKSMPNESFLPEKQESTTPPVKDPAPAKEPARELPATEPKETPEPQTRTEEEPEPEETHVKEPKEQPASLDKPPKSWKPSEQAKWASLDPGIRAEVHRRERETTRAIGESANARKFTQNFHQAVQPFAAKYQRAGLDPIQTVTNLMQADHYLSSAPMAERAKFMAKLIKDYEINVDMLDQAISGQGNPNDAPESIVERMIEAKLAPLQQHFQASTRQQQTAEQRERAAQQKQLDDMEADETNYPHFSIVAADMADLTELSLRRGVYLDPKTAYTRAVAINPEATALEQERSKQRKATQANEAATRSLGASLSVSGSPTSLRGEVPPDDLRGTIEAAWNAVHGR